MRSNRDRHFLKDRSKDLRSPIKGRRLKMIDRRSFSQRSPTLRHSTHNKRQDETTYVQIELEKGKEEKENKINQQQECQEEDSTQARGIRIFQAHEERGGGMAPRLNNRIT